MRFKTGRTPTHTDSKRPSKAIKGHCYSPRRTFQATEQTSSKSGWPNGFHMSNSIRRHHWMDKKTCITRQRRGRRANNFHAISQDLGEVPPTPTFLSKRNVAPWIIAMALVFTTHMSDLLIARQGSHAPLNVDETCPKISIAVYIDTLPKTTSQSPLSSNMIYIRQVLPWPVTRLSIICLLCND